MDLNFQFRQGGSLYVCLPLSAPEGEGIFAYPCNASKGERNFALVLPY